MANQETNALTMSGAAFEAFRKRERGGVLTQASIGFTLILVIGVAAFVAVCWPVLSDVISWYAKLFSQLPNPAAGPIDPNAPPPVVPPPPSSLFLLFPAYFLILFFIYVTTAAYEAACLRWMVRGEAGGIFLGLNLSRDTWRIWLGYWLWVFGYIGVIYAIEFGAILVGLVVGLVVGAASNGNPEAGPAAGIGAGVIFAIGACFAYVWAVIRFAPAAATSIALRRFAFFDAWRVSKGKFWAMFGSFFLVFVIYFVLILVIEIGAFAFIAAQMPAMTPGSFDTQALIGVITRPLNVIVLATLYLVLMIAGWFFYLSMFGINARVVKIAINEGRLPEANPSAVF